MKDFTHLHVHTHYSFLDGFGKVEDWVKRAKKLGFKSLGITDHGNMCGALDFYLECKKQGIKPVIGSEFYICKDRLLKEKNDNNKSQHIILIAKNQKGYKNLIRLSSLSWQEGLYYKPRIDFKLLKKYHEGLICTSACIIGYVSIPIQLGKMKTAVTRTKKLKKLFGKDFYLEIQPHDLDGQRKSNLIIVSLAKKYNIPLLVTNDCHYIKSTDHKAHSILLLVQTKKTLADKEKGEDVFQFTGDSYYLKTRKEMYNSFRKYHPELFKGFKKDIIKGMNNTNNIAKRCKVNIAVGNSEVPSYGVFNPSKKLLKLLNRGWDRKIKKRLNMKDQNGYKIKEKLYKKRFKYEYNMIKDMELSDYFLIVQDFVNWARKKGIKVGNARGSVAGSLVAYLLGITNIDPLKFELPFERFLSPTRTGAGNIPDIDIDFEKSRRDEVKQYLMEKWGEEKVAEVITFHVMRARNILKDVSRVYGVDWEVVNNATKFIGNNDTLQDIEENFDRYEIVESGENLVEKFYKKHKKVWKIAKKLEGQYRHFGTHAAGVIIGSQDLKNYCPVQIKNLSDPRVISQWNMYDLTRRGLLKVDILGLVTLDIIKDTMKMIDEDIDIDNLNIADKNVYKEFKNGNTLGVFQLENYHFSKLCERCQPNNIVDIAVINSLGRPGAKNTGQDEKYLENRENPDSIEYAHPDLEKILGNTYGAMVFQEQVMEICNKIGCFDPVDVNEIRESIKHFRHDEMRSYGKQFVKNAVNKKGMDKEDAKELWNEVKTHSSYSFNKNHAVSYSMISYQTMYLKRYFPHEFFCAMLKERSRDKAKARDYINKLRRARFRIADRPDVNRSDKNFRIIKKKGRKMFLKGFLCIEGIADKTANKIVEERAKGGDWIERLTPSVQKKLLECNLKY